MILIIGEASAGQFGVDFDGVSLLPGFVRMTRLSSGFFCLSDNHNLIGGHGLLLLDEAAAKMKSAIALLLPQAPLLGLPASTLLLSGALTHSAGHGHRGRHDGWSSSSSSYSLSSWSSQSGKGRESGGSKQRQRLGCRRPHRHLPQRLARRRPQLSASGG